MLLEPCEEKNIISGQANKQLKVEKHHEENITVIEPYRYDQESCLRKFYLAIIMHEYPLNIVEHEYFVDFIISLHPSFPIKSRTTVRKDLMDFFSKKRKGCMNILIPLSAVLAQLCSCGH